MQRALISGGVYFLILFALGFALGTIRVLFLAPRIGVLAATILEILIILTAAFFICRWIIKRFQVPRILSIRWSMVLWSIALLILFETFFGALLFGRSLSQQWAALSTPVGLLGLSDQIIAALFPLFVGKGSKHRADNRWCLVVGISVASHKNPIAAV